FRDEAIPAAVLADLLEVAHYAPTGSNRQQVRWLVVHDSAQVRRLAGLTADWLRHNAEGQQGNLTARYGRTLATATARGMDFTGRGAPHLVFAHGPRGRDTDGVIALTYLELAAFARGLGVCWAGFITSASREWAPMQAALALPEGETVYGALMLGYPRYRYQRHPLRDDLRVTWR
ncbi:MAG: nitroreductase family protein, partial [Chloroflexota bacterium]